MKPDYATLKTRQREIRDGLHSSLVLRTHRALSWLQRAELETDDPDARFVFLWIAFNAAYATEGHDRQRFRERRLLLAFLSRLIAGDGQRLLYEIVWREFPNSIRLLLDNPYVFQPFWDYHKGRISEEDWRRQFARGKASAQRALGRMDTKKVLAVLLERLYVLRNQIVHGGATWNSSVNRSQVKEGAAIMGLLVPAVIHLMLEDRNPVWGEACYPVVK